MKNNLSVLPGHENMTPREVASLTLNEIRADEIDDVLIISYTKTGTLRMRSSAMTRAEANWMLDQAKVEALAL